MASHPRRHRPCDVARLAEVDRRQRRLRQELREALVQRPVPLQPRGRRQDLQGLLPGNERRHPHDEPPAHRGRPRPRVGLPVLGAGAGAVLLPPLHLLGRRQREADLLGRRGMPVGGREAQDPDHRYLDRAPLQAHHRRCLAARSLQVRRPGRSGLRRLLDRRGQREGRQVEPEGAAEGPGAVARRRAGQARQWQDDRGQVGLAGVGAQPGGVHARPCLRDHRGSRRQDRRGRAHLHHAPEPASRQWRHPLPAGPRPDGPRRAEHPRSAAHCLPHRQLRRARRQPRLLEGPGRRLLRPRQHDRDRPRAGRLGHSRGHRHHGARQHAARPFRGRPDSADPELREVPAGRELPAHGALRQPHPHR